MFKSLISLFKNDRERILENVHQRSYTMVAAVAAGCYAWQAESPIIPFAILGIAFALAYERYIALALLVPATLEVVWWYLM